MWLLLIFLLRLFFDLPMMLPSVVKPGGSFIASGIIQQKKDQVKEALIASGFEITETILMEDWVAIIAKRILSVKGDGITPFYLEFLLSIFIIKGNNM